MLRLRSILAVLLCVVIAMAPTPIASAAATSFEAEAMAISKSTAGKLVADTGASGGSAYRLAKNSTLTTNVTVPAQTQFSVIAKGQNCFGSPNMVIQVDGTKVFSKLVTSTSWATYEVSTPIPPGTHTIAIVYTNDFALGCDRNLWVDRINLVSGGTEPPLDNLCADPPPSATQPFVDDFNGPAGTKPNPQTWKYQLAATGLKVYTNSARNASLDGNGNLAIVARKESITVPGAGTFPYTSARLHTQGSLEPCHGRIAARIKFPQGQGLWPVFFLLGKDCETQGWPQCGEVDIMEQQGTLAGSTIHAPGYSLPVRAPMNISTGFHEYWMDWDRDKIVVGIDNTATATWTPANLPAGTTWLFNDHPMMVVLMLGVGGSGGSPNASTQFPASMLVDWVRYTPPE